jgi:hypothetical protein
MTGVDVMPISGEMKGQSASRAGTVVKPSLRELASHRGVSRIAVCVEGIDAVVLGGDKEYIVASFPWNLHAAEEEQLSIDISVRVQSEDLSKVLNIYTGRRQFGLVENRAGEYMAVWPQPR